MTVYCRFQKANKNIGIRAILPIVDKIIEWNIHLRALKKGGVAETGQRG